MDTLIITIILVAMACTLGLGLVWCSSMGAHFDMYAYVDGVTQIQLSKLCENGDLLYLDMALNQTACPKCSLECYPGVTRLHFQIRHQAPWQNHTRITELYLESRGFTVYEAWQSDD